MGVRDLMTVMIMTVCGKGREKVDDDGNDYDGV